MMVYIVARKGNIGLKPPHHCNYINLHDACVILLTGCELSDGCAGSNIGEHICSLGEELQCQCQYPQLTGDDDVCVDGMSKKILILVFHA